MESSNRVMPEERSAQGINLRPVPPTKYWVLDTTPRPTVTECQMETVAHIDGFYRHLTNNASFHDYIIYVRECSTTPTGACEYGKEPQPWGVNEVQEIRQALCMAIADDENWMKLEVQIKDRAVRVIEVLVDWQKGKEAEIEEMVSRVQMEWLQRTRAAFNEMVDRAHPHWLQEQIITQYRHMEVDAGMVETVLHAQAVWFAEMEVEIQDMIVRAQDEWLQRVVGEVERQKNLSEMDA